MSHWPRLTDLLLQNNQFAGMSICGFLVICHIQQEKHVIVPSHPIAPIHQSLSICAVPVHLLQAACQRVWAAWQRWETSCFREITSQVRSVRPAASGYKRLGYTRSQCRTDVIFISVTLFFSQSLYLSVCLSVTLGLPGVCLSGPIPDSLPNLAHIESLDVSNNKLSGESWQASGR